jgi:hypothetical protein
MNTSGQETYIQSPDFERLAEAQSLSEELWLIAFTLAKPATTAELTSACNLTPDATAKALAHLLACGLIRKQTLTFKEFLAKRNGAQPVVEKTESIVPAIQPPVMEQVIPAQPAPASEIYSIRLGLLPVSQTPATPIFVTRFGGERMPGFVTVVEEIRPVAVPARAKSKKPSTNSPMKLRPVINAIETKGGGGISGQLLVYRVFLRVPFGSLYDEGITSLKLVDENSMVRNPDLKAAILDAAREIAGVELAA